MKRPRTPPQSNPAFASESSPETQRARSAVRRRLQHVAAAPSVAHAFGASDSDDDHCAQSFPTAPFTAAATSRTEPRANLAQNQLRQEQPDTLDAFMHTLAETPLKNNHHAQRYVPPSHSDLDELSERSCDISNRSTRMPSAHPQTGSDHDDDRSDSDDANFDASRTYARDLSLNPVDHSALSYAPFVCILRSNNNPRSATQALSSFEELSDVLPAELLSKLRAKFQAPTPVQSRVIPAALNGKHVLARAPTGSGKTLAYLLPLLAHVSANSSAVAAASVSTTASVAKTQLPGPRALIAAPTRELALQIANVLRQLSTSMSASSATASNASMPRVVLVLGGVPKYVQFKKLRAARAGVVVCTPGRMIDMLKMRAVSLSHTTFLVLDEADRMLDLGFEPQVTALLSQIRPDAQRLFLSATLSPRIQRLAGNAVRITISSNSHSERDHRVTNTPAECAMVSDHVTERYIVLRNTPNSREDWLVQIAPELTHLGLAIVFCSTRGGAAALSNTVRARNVPALCLHGETDAEDRAEMLKMFRDADVKLLITTDLAARGLDIPHVNNVVNYDVAKNWEWHVHRVGRTGRAGNHGTAYTLLCEGARSDAAFAEKALAAFKRARRTPPPELREFAPRSRRSYR